MGNFADKLRAEITSKNKEIMEREIIPRKETILNAVAKGIQRIGYVRVDTFRNECCTAEGRFGIHKPEYLDALSEFLKSEGFTVRKFWWGMSTDGPADGLTITL